MQRIAAIDIRGAKPSQSRFPLLVPISSKQGVQRVVGLRVRLATSAFNAFDRVRFFAKVRRMQWVIDDRLRCVGSAEGCREATLQCEVLYCYCTY